ncbi:hypothetical protein LRS13_12280 [Svornostia abyssi]|uniref:DUF2867 domain-containing protein n=1 Tax=Svornostia abyssi TaxID=2898438 RepID=A0ABY5PNL4_9ACTN|nr:hypothetical protein LRS13_12280 [Parviterribacteraceae bacterium J379]
MARIVNPAVTPTAPQLLQSWLPDAEVVTRHRRRAAADGAALWQAARAIRLDDTRALGRLVRWRIPETPGDLPYAELFARPPFTVLDEGPDWSISGLVGRIWTLARDYPPLDGPDAFTAWATPGTVRVAFAHWVEPDGDGSVLRSEARVQAVDRRAALRLRSLWLAVGPFERLIGAEPLALAAARADRQA